MDVEKSGIPKRFWGRTPETLSDWGTEALRGQVTDWLAYPKDHIRDDGVGLLFVGPPGVLKTTMACAVGQVLLQQGYSVFYVTFSGYIRRLLNCMDLKSAWQKQDDYDAYTDWKTLDKQVKDIRNVYDVVILDDVGKEHSTNTRFAEDELDFLLRHRYDMSLPTLPTTNVMPDSWAMKYSDAMESFIHEAFITLRVEGEDRRK